jgi:hypothetical protein
MIDPCIVINLCIARLIDDPPTAEEPTGMDDLPTGMDDLPRATDDTQTAAHARAWASAKW